MNQAPVLYTWLLGMDISMSAYVYHISDYNFASTI